MSKLKQEIVGSSTAPVIVLFGGSAQRRHDVIELLESLGDITVYGTLSEAEGLQKLEELRAQVNLVLIGGRYATEQRDRIQSWLAEHIPQAKITQPGHEYPYSDAAILADIRAKL